MMSEPNASEPGDDSLSMSRSGQSTDAGTTAGPTDVMIFVRGLGEAEHMEPGHVAEILCWEMNQRASNKHTTFAVEPTSVRADVIYRIERTDGDLTRPVLDVYCEKAASAFAGDKTPATALRRVVTLALTVLAGIIIWCAAWVRRNKEAKSFPHMLQLLFALLILLALGAYFLTAVYALAEVIAAALRGAEGDGRPLVKWPQWVVLGAAVVGVLLPNLRNRLTDTAELYEQMMRYLWNAGVRNRLTGQLQDLIDRINRRPEVEHIHLVGASFGSLVILDTVFPAGTSDPARLQQIRSISTIGCPFDLVRMLQPPYAEERTEATANPFRWINTFAPIDVLASNFRDDDKTGAAIRGVELHDGTVKKPDVNSPWNANVKLNLVNLLMLRSLVEHGQYWSRNTRSPTALGVVVATIFDRTDVLQ